MNWKIVIETIPGFTTEGVLECKQHEYTVPALNMDEAYQVAALFTRGLHHRPQAVKANILSIEPA